MIEAEGYPSLVYYREGDPSKPLVVFIPGGYHLARVFYGHSKGVTRDFAGYWLKKLGFPVLGVSYPLDHPVFGSLHPEMTVTDWSRMTAAIVSSTVKTRGLSNRVVFAGWSMAGRTAPTLNLFAMEKGLDVTGFISLAATPPLFLNADVTEDFRLAPNGMREVLNPPESRRGHNRFCWIGKALEELAEINGRPVLDEDAYRREFCGNHPANLNGEAVRYRSGALVKDMAGAVADMRCFEYGSYPMTACIVPDSPNDLRHALSDVSTWTFINHHQMLWQMRSKKTGCSFNPDNFRIKMIKDIFQSLPEVLVKHVHGNHLFFLGEAGARSTARAIAELIDVLDNIKQKLYRSALPGADAKRKSKNDKT